MQTDVTLVSAYANFVEKRFPEIKTKIDVPSGFFKLGSE